MFKFTLQLVQTEDPSNGLPAFGLRADGLVLGPHLSQLQTASLPPSDAENLKAINKLLDSATQSALNAGCLEIQQALGIESGDVAGVFFSGPDEVSPIARALADYLEHEIALAQVD